MATDRSIAKRLVLTYNTLPSSPQTGGRLDVLLRHIGNRYAEFFTTRVASTPPQREHVFTFSFDGQQLWPPLDTMDKERIMKAVERLVRFSQQRLSEQMGDVELDHQNEQQTIVDLVPY